MKPFNEVRRSKRVAWSLYPLALCVMLGGLGLAACDSGGSSEEEEGTPLEEACEHMAEGPFVDIQATLDAASAPPANLAHTSMKILLVETGGMYEGYVAFPSSVAAETLFFLSKAVPIGVTDAQQAAVAIESSDTAITACSEVAASHTIDLSIGTWWIHFGPTTEPSVHLVFEAVGGAHAHE